MAAVCLDFLYIWCCKPVWALAQGLRVQVSPGLGPVPRGLELAVCAGVGSWHQPKSGLAEPQALVSPDHRHKFLFFILFTKNNHVITKGIYVSNVEKITSCQKGEVCESAGNILAWLSPISVEHCWVEIVCSDIGTCSFFFNKIDTMYHTRHLPGVPVAGTSGTPLSFSPSFTPRVPSHLKWLGTPK
jgi:hypothetical protein